MQTKKICAIVMVAVLYAQVAVAQWVVFDPSNYATNYITTIRSIKAEIDRSVQIANQIKQYQEMLRQAKQLADSPRLMRDALQAELRVNEYTKSVYAVYGDATKYKQLFDDRYKYGTADRLKYGRDYMMEAAGHYKRKDAHLQALKNEIEVTDSLAQNMAKAKDMQAKIPELATSQETFQFMATQMSVMIQQNNDLIKTLSAQNLRTNASEDVALNASGLEVKRAKDINDALKKLEANPGSLTIPSTRTTK